MLNGNYNEFAEIFTVFFRCWHPGVGTLEHTCHRIFNPVHMKKRMNERKKERNLDFSGSRQLTVVKR
jgi:hypothetical protein